MFGGDFGAACGLPGGAPGPQGPPPPAGAPPPGSPPAVPKSPPSSENASSTSDSDQAQPHDPGTESETASPDDTSTNGSSASSTSDPAAEAAPENPPSPRAPEARQLPRTPPNQPMAGPSRGRPVGSTEPNSLNLPTLPTRTRSAFREWTDNERQAETLEEERRRNYERAREARLLASPGANGTPPHRGAQRGRGSPAPGGGQPRAHPSPVNSQLQRLREHAEWEQSQLTRLNAIRDRIHGSLPPQSRQQLTNQMLAVKAMIDRRRAALDLPPLP